MKTYSVSNNSVLYKNYLFCCNKRAFTILEIFVVLAIMAVLILVSFNYYKDNMDDAKRAVTATNLKLINEAITRYSKDHNSYPKYVDLKTDSKENGVLKTYLNRPLSDLLKEINDIDKEYKIKYKVILPHIRNITAEGSDVFSSNNAIWISDEDFKNSGEANKFLYMVNEIIATLSPSLP
ncbi:MAG: type II secretion system protein [Candidatus Riflebacteria bacterium]|nr:type II secretion system protein [Candidatus Riflebacteria bacterium]